MSYICICITAVSFFVQLVSGCQFYPPGEYLRFVRVPENLKVGEEVLKIEVHPRRNLNLLSTDKSDDVHYFTYQEYNKTMISLILARSLDDLVDTHNPQNVLKFKLNCDYDDGEDTISSSLSVTVYVEDINDHAPIFTGTPYHLTVDELTPVGLTIFRRIQATDRDKPNTPNSDVQYAITDGNERGIFALDGNHQAFLVLKKPLDYDSGDREFTITVTASDRGIPQRSTNATVRITVQDADDLSPKFTKGVYRTKLAEFYPLTGEKIHHRLKFEPPIFAYDQDLAIDTPIRYDILAGNDRHLFYLDHVNGSLFLEREIDLEAEGSLPGNTFVLQIQASQINAPSKTGVARVEIEILDLNDNLPEFEVDHYNISIVENLPNGFSVLQVVAKDSDQGDNSEFTYELEDKTGAFTIDNRETRSSIAMRAYAKEKTFSVITNKLDSSTVPIEVTLLDVNDNNPTFIPNNIYEFVCFTNRRVGEVIGQVHAIDPDLEQNGLVYYQIQQTRNNSNLFNIDGRTGQIFANVSNLNVSRHTLLIEAFDQPLNPSETRFSVAVVTIIVKLMNATRMTTSLNYPEFIGGPYQFWIGYMVPVGSTVGQIRVLTSNNNKKIMFDLLHSYREGVPFAVEERLGTITVVDELNKYNRTTYEFEAIVIDEEGYSIVTNVSIHIVHPNNDTTLFTKSSYINTNSSKTRRDKSNFIPFLFNPEDAQVGIALFRLEAEDLDLNENAVITYDMVSETYIPNSVFSSNPFHVNQHFMINPNSGEIIVARTLPPESEFRLNIAASDREGLNDNITIKFYIKDVNDHAPMFKKPWYTFDIEESVYTHKVLGKIEATDSDFGENSNVSYRIQFPQNQIMPFIITQFDGILKVHGQLDREKKDKYVLSVIASDNPTSGHKLSSTVNVEINVLDVNDNPPIFYGYDDVIDFKNTQVPVYFAHVSENAPVGTSVTKVFANDSDFIGNGNGLFLFSVVQNTQSKNYFTIDSKNGVITTNGKLDVDNTKIHNVTVVVSDLGSPSLSSTAMVMISVVNMEDDIKNVSKTIFLHRYYEIEVEENVPVPLKLISLNVTALYRRRRLRYSIVADKNSDIKKTFKIDPRNGTIFIISSPDRERREFYEFIVRLDEYKVSRDMTVMVYPVTNERLGNLGLNEVKIVIRVTDVNDNEPKFSMGGRPIVTAIPANVHYGYEVLRLQATDPDLGLNSEIRYQILGTSDEVSRHFIIDGLSGQIRTVSSFAKDAGKVFGFDVKATDRRGAEDGKSAIVNVLVYILNDQKQLVMILKSEPLEVESDLDNITSTLYNITGYDIRVRKLEPHSVRNELDSKLTDIYLYGVDPLLNVVVDSHKVLAFTTNGSDLQKSKSRPKLLSSLEVGVVILGCFVFICTLLVLTCVLVFRHRKKRLNQQNYLPTQPSGYALSTSELSKSILFPSSFEEAVQYSEPRREITKLSNTDKPHVDNYSRVPRSSTQIEERSRSVGGLETSMTSLHSSGRDSGIIDGGHQCPCGQSTHTSEESCNSNYEDSLNSENQSKSQDKVMTRNYENERLSKRKQRRKRNRTLTGGAVGYRAPTVAFLNPYSQQNHLTPSRFLSAQSFELIVKPGFSNTSHIGIF
ncbi:hypothetical protein RN001_005268 [Aquatica leii]|uniref:Cadherin domain-containing protein n=1 Tax=Aquatica leii TaxID=1421715 RepID=A0AAN7PCA4_9COLE|nr:hypothetical protein RN001_005268 [Aquatica leii]